MADEYVINARFTADTTQFSNAVNNVIQSTSKIGDKFSSITSKVNSGAKSWGVDIDQFYSKGSQIFKNFGVDIDKFASHFGVSGKLVAAIAVATTALTKLGQEFDELSKKITLGTGASGEALRELEDSAQCAMIAGVGRSASEVGQMIADLNTRFAVTGDELTTLTHQFDKFSNVTGTNTSSAINSIADVMKRWNIDVKDTNNLLDQMTVAGQMSGISMDELSSGLKQGQQYFSQFGLSATQSIAMLSSFKQNGIDTSTVLTGMRTALSKFTNEGKNATVAFKEVSESIKNAGSDSEAMSIAIENFGSKAGPEMVKAFRNGSASVDEYTESLRKAKGAMNATEEASRTSKDAMADLKSSLTATFSEFGQGFSGIFKGVIDTVTNFVRILSPIITPIGDMFKTVFKGIGDLLSWLSNEFTNFIKHNSRTWKAITSTLNNFGKAFRKIFDNVFKLFKNIFGAIFAILEGRWEVAWLNVKLVAMRVCKAVIDVVSLVGTGIGKFLNIFIDGINKVIEGYNMLAEILPILEKTEFKVPTFQNVDIAETTGLNDLIDRTQERLDELNGLNGRIEDLGEANLTYIETSLSEISGTRTSVGMTEPEAKESLQWTEKVLQQQLNAITEEKKAKLQSMVEQGEAQAELDKINSEYALKQLELYDRIAEIRKSKDLETVSTFANAEEEKNQLEIYYAEERAKYEKEVTINSYKETQQAILQESTKWEQKLLEQKMEFAKKAMELQLAEAEQSEKTAEEIYNIKKESTQKQVDLFKKLQNLRMEDELATAKSEKEKAQITEYYANETQNTIHDMWQAIDGDMKTEGDSWVSITLKVMLKITKAVVDGVKKLASLVKKGISSLWNFMQKSPDEILDSLLKMSDTIQTFFVETLPNLPAFLESGFNIIENVANVLTEPSTMTMIIDNVLVLIEKLINLMVSKLPDIIVMVGKFMGELIKSLVSMLTKINWFEVLWNLVKAIWESFVELLKGMFSGLGNVFKDIWDGVVGGFKKVGNWFSDLGGHFKNLFTGKGWATGVNNAPSGLALVGEQGPELIDMHGGERVYNASTTEKIFSSAGNGGNNFNVTFNNLQDTSAYAMLRLLKNYQRDMAINGVI